MIRKVDFIAYHDLQAQAGESIYEEMSKSFDCKWRIGPDQIPSGAEIAIMLDHTVFQPKIRKGKRAYKYLFHLSHDLGDVEIYKNEYDRLIEYDIVFAPSAFHFKYAQEQLSKKTIVLQTGWAKYDKMNLSEKYYNLESKIKKLPYKYTILYAPSFAWTYEWTYLLPLFKKLPCNIIIKNHICVNNGQAFPKGQESEYKQHLESADKMEKVLLEFNSPSMIVAPREINICSLFQYVDVLISDQSSVSLEYLPFGLSIETGRHNPNENDLAPESSRLSKEVRFLDKTKLCEILSSIQMFEEFLTSEKPKGNMRSNEINRISAGKLTTQLIKSYLIEVEKVNTDHPIPFLGFDPCGEVFTYQGRVLRGVFTGHGSRVLNVYERCVEAGLFDSGVVRTSIYEDESLRHMGYDLLLEHERVPFITYAHEWTPEMLKDVALFQLDLNATLIDAGLILKDCGVTTNVLFEGPKPVYVDFLSIIPLSALTEEEWLKPATTTLQQYAGVSEKSQYLYEIFKRMFYPGILFPLYLIHQNKSETSRKRLLETALNTTMDTITEQETFSPSDRFVQSTYQKYRHLKEQALREDNWRQFFIIQRQEVQDINVSLLQSGYSDYYELKGEDFDFSPSSDWKPKQWGAYNALTSLKPDSVLDIGANTGWFSILAARQGARVISLDNDVACMDILYRRAKHDNLSILPLIIDFLNPTPDVAVMDELRNDPHMLNSKFKKEVPLLLSSDKRIACDMVFALALIHHLCLGGGRHLNEVIELLSLYANKHLVLEFVTKDDPLIVNEPDFFKAQYTYPGAFDWYSLDACIDLLSRFFGSIEQTLLAKTRILLICTDKRESASSPYVRDNESKEQSHQIDSDFEQNRLMRARNNPKILFTTPILEHPPAGGPTLRIENSIKALNQISELHLAVRISQDALGGLAGEEYYHRYCHAFAYTPYLSGSNIPEHEKHNAHAIVNYAAEQGIEIIWCGYGNVSYQLMKTIKSLNPRLKVLCDTDSVWSRFVLRELPFENDPARRWQIEAEGKAKELEEAQWVDFCDVTTAVSEVDAEYYRSLASDKSRIHIFSNVIDLDSYRTHPEQPPNFRKPCLILAGSYGSYSSPMNRAAKWVIDEVLPLVLHSFPGVTLYLVGSGSDRYIGSLNSPNVVVTGKLPSVLPYLCNADIALVPLFFESGTRFKILEAAACGIPIVSTTLGAEGIDVVHGEHILIADSPNDFASAIIELIRDKRYAKIISQKCNNLVWCHFSIKSLVTEAQQIIQYLSEKKYNFDVNMADFRTNKTPVEHITWGDQLVPTISAQSEFVNIPLPTAMPTKPSARVSLVTGLPKDLIQKGIAQYSQQDIAGAEQTFLQALTLTPNDVDALVSLGKIYLETNHSPLALEKFMAAIRVNPQDEDAWLGIGLIAKIADNRHLLAKAVEMVRIINPTHPHLRELLG